MNLKLSDIDYIIDTLRKMTVAAQKQKSRDVSTLSSLRKELKNCLVPRWDDIWPYTTQSQRDPGYKREHRGRGNVKYDLQRDIEQSFLKEPLDSCVIIQNSQKIIDELECIKANLEYLLDKASGGEAGKRHSIETGTQKNKVVKTIIWFRDLVLVIYEKTAKAFFDSYFDK